MRWTVVRSEMLRAVPMAAWRVGQMEAAVMALVEMGCAALREVLVMEQQVVWRVVWRVVCRVVWRVVWRVVTAEAAWETATVAECRVMLRAA